MKSKASLLNDHLLFFSDYNLLTNTFHISYTFQKIKTCLITCLIAKILSTFIQFSENINKLLKNVHCLPTNQHPHSLAR